jgi:activator of 2-hydroxyglutaryl-CoA dehydratase
MRLTAGIDIGSITAKAAILKDGELLGMRVIFTGYNAEARAASLMLRGLGLSTAEIVGSSPRGTAERRFADKAVTEIMCHAAGAFLDLPPGL